MSGCAEKAERAAALETSRTTRAVTTDCATAVAAAIDAGVVTISCQRRAGNVTGYGPGAMDDLTTRCSNFSTPFNIPPACCTQQGFALDGGTCDNQLAESLTTPRNYRLTPSGIPCDTQGHTWCPTQTIGEGTPEQTTFDALDTAICPEGMSPDDVVQGNLVSELYQCGGSQLGGTFYTPKNQGGRAWDMAAATLLAGTPMNPAPLVKGLQISASFADGATLPSNMPRWLLRLPDEWNGYLVFSLPGGNTSEFGSDINVGDQMVVQHYAYASFNKGVFSQRFARAANGEPVSYADTNPRSEISPDPAACLAQVPSIGGIANGNPKFIHQYALEPIVQTAGLLGEVVTPRWFAASSLSLTALGQIKRVVQAVYGQPADKTFIFGVSGGGWIGKQMVEMDHAIGDGLLNISGIHFERVPDAWQGPPVTGYLVTNFLDDMISGILYYTLTRYPHFQLHAGHVFDEFNDLNGRWPNMFAEVQDPQYPEWSGLRVALGGATARTPGSHPDFPATMMGPEVTLPPRNPPFPAVRPPPNYNSYMGGDYYEWAANNGWQNFACWFVRSIDPSWNMRIRDFSIFRDFNPRPSDTPEAQARRRTWNYFLANTGDVGAVPVITIGGSMDAFAFPDSSTRRYDYLLETRGATHAYYEIQNGAHNDNFANVFPQEIVFSNWQSAFDVLRTKVLFPDFPLPPSQCIQRGSNGTVLADPPQDRTGPCTPRFAGGASRAVAQDPNALINLDPSQHL